MPRSAAARLVVLIASLILAGPAHALKPWDQQAVTALAADLAKATRALKNTVRKEPMLGTASESGDRATMRFWEALDGLEKTTRKLATQTKAGKGHAETLTTAKNIRMLVRDAEQFGSKLYITGFMQEKIAPVEALLDQLEPYYF